MDATDERHGSSAGYVAGCRETCCRTAIADYSRDLRKRQYLAGGPLRVDAAGTKRRIRALVALGWSLPQIDAKLGRERTYCAAILCGPDRVLRSTADHIAAVYERLSMRLPENEPRANRQVIARSKNYARQQGWLPPLAYDDIDAGLAEPTDTTEAVDPVVVERILAGDWRLPANRAERLEVIRRFPGSQNELERLTGWNVSRDVRLTRNPTEEVA